MEIPRITPQEVKERLDRDDSVFFIDARNPTDWGQSDVKLPGAVRIPVQEMEQKMDQLPRDKTIVTYCT
jgi:rhodanese-related sulfurtransferase